MIWRPITLKQFPVFSRQWMLEAFRDDMVKILGYGFKNFKSLDTGIYADQKEYDDLKKIMVNRLKKDKEEIKKLTEDWTKASNKLIEQAKEIGKLKFKNKKNEEILKIMDSILGRFKKTAAYLYMVDTLDNYYEKWLDNLLTIKLKDKNRLSEYRQILTTCTKITHIHKAHKSLLDIIHKASEFTIEEIRKSDKLRPDLVAYTKEFKWLGYDTGIGKDFTVMDTLKKIDGLLSKGETTETSNNRERYLNIIKELRLSKKDKEQLSIIDAFIYARAYRGEANSIAGAYIRPILEELALRCNTDYNSLIYLTLNEIKESLEKKHIDKDIVDKRKKAFGLLMINGKIKIYSGDEVKQLEDKTELADVNEVKGTVANPGKVKGKVKVVIKSSEFNKVEKGDILVSKMTTPEFMVVLEKCVGIVTDIGGITCHAAIVSRELGIPAIIGTQIATKVFKDGDLVEVDAINGIVKRIK